MNVPGRTIAKPIARLPTQVGAPRAPLDVLLYAWLALLTIATWRISELQLFRPGDDTGYWIGVAGASMLLGLFSYPLRKYLRFLHRLGKVKWWFLLHMVLGVAGTLLILLHSNFETRSTNAAVALYSMLVVAGSGVIGRFLHVRVHRGLHGERSNLAELRARAGFAQSEMKSMLGFAPEVERRLRDFVAAAEGTGTGLAAAMRRVVVLPLLQHRLYLSCRRDLDRVLAIRAAQSGWSPAKLRERRRQARGLVRCHLVSAVRVAQYTAYERLFGLWHVLHVPFVYLFLATAVFHVVAVHAY